MTKKHFIALADMARIELAYQIDMQIEQAGVPHSLAEDLKDTIFEVLADFCESQNPRFDRQLWLDYVVGKVGSGGGKRK